MKNFWQTLPRPFFVLAPMADVTDAAFRRVVAKYSKIGHPMSDFVMYTEFVSADGLVKGNREILLKDLIFSDEERPIVAQFFTSDSEMMEKAAALAQELRFDGVDINMGCPDRSVEKQGAGAKLMLNPALARELIAAAKRGAPTLPVSVKTRLGYNNDVLEDWLPALLEAEPAAVILHARTRREMSKTPAHWERVARAVKIRDALLSRTLVVGNGDVKDVDDARAKARETGSDGVMIGRGIFGKPWLFDLRSRTVVERLGILIEHVKLFEELLGDVKSFAVMKKHFKAYLSGVALAKSDVEGFSGARELRARLMESSTATEVERIVTNFLSSSTSDHLHL